MAFSIMKDNALCGAERGRGGEAEDEYGMDEEDELQGNENDDEMRTFAQAYRQALVNAQTGGGAAASASRGVVGRNQMTVDEASRILGLEKNTLKLASLEAKYQKLYEQNSVEKGGSPYLQYKIVGAKEVLERECIARGEKPPNQESAEKKGTEKIDGQ